MPSRFDGRLAGKVALVTGAASGMGAATARRFVADGARVVIADVAVEAGEALAAELGGTAEFVKLDVSERDEWMRAIERTEASFGPLNILMNNAGIGAPGCVERYDEAVWERAIRINLLGVLLGMQTALPSLQRAGRGSVVNVSSLQGREADVNLMPYVASKFGVRGISKSAAVEWGRYGIRVNTIFPGFIHTGITHGVPDHVLGHIPLRRAGSGTLAGNGAHIAGLAAFLASDRAAFISGAEIVIDGGKSIRFPSVAEDYGKELAAMAGKEGQK